MHVSSVPASLTAPYANQDGPQALHRLFPACFSHHGGSTEPIAQFLISLYNAEYAHVDMVRLCRAISLEHFEDVLTVMRWYREAVGKLDELWQIYGPAGYSLPREPVTRFGTARPHG